MSRRLPVIPTRRVDGGSDVVAPRAGSGSTSSKSWAVVRCPSRTIRSERREGEVLITVDGAPPMAVVGGGGAVPLVDENGVALQRVGD